MYKELSIFNINIEVSLTSKNIREEEAEQTKNGLILDI